MSDFIVDESRFLLDDDEYDSSFVPAGLTLPDGIIFGEKLDDAPQWQLYSSADRRFDLLVVKPELAQKWDDASLLPPEALMPLEVGGAEYYLLITPSSHALKRVTQVRFQGSQRAAWAFFSAMMRTRAQDTETSLRDALYCELFNVMLPCYSLVPKVADRALALNAMRGRNDPENLSSPDEMQGGGVSFSSFSSDLRAHGYEVAGVQPYFEPGEIIEDFTGIKKGSMVTGPLALRPQYQIFDTSSSSYILILEKLWAEALLSTSLLNMISLNSIPLGGHLVYALTLPRRKALEALDDRHYAQDMRSLFEVAQAVRRTRAAVPKADLKNALWVQDLGILLPVEFTSGSGDDRSLITEVLSGGPFAAGPMLDDVASDIRLVAVSAG